MVRDYARFPADENGDALWHMAEAGDDLGKPREVDFAVIFPTETAALQFAVQLLRSGHKVSFGPYDGDPDRPWQVYAHRVLLPTHAAITAVETDLARDAAPLGGRNDGWGCLAQDQAALPVAPDESGAAMRQAGGARWRLTLAPSWQASDDGDCLSIARPEGLGTLQISAARKSTAVTDDDLADFAVDHLDAGAIARPVTLGDFSGIAIRYGVDGTHWRQWFLRHGPVALFVTYNCADVDRGIEQAAVDQMLGSLRARSGGD